MGWIVSRVYLDFNATMPLRPEARAAMIKAMDIAGNPSSVHAEGRDAKSLVEAARMQVARAVGAEGAEVVFTASATEAAALAMAGRALAGAEVEHDAVFSHLSEELQVSPEGQVLYADGDPVSVQLANSETGLLQDLADKVAVCDATQAFGKIPLAFNWLNCGMMLISAHKIGGPKGVGALVMERGTDLTALLKGGGQEMGRRAGTENVIGIAGFAAAATAAVDELEAGVWDRVRAMRDGFEAQVLEAAPDVVIAGAGGRRLPNTSCLIAPGWKGETQVMQMDLKGFAISAGSACSSGKVRESRVLRAMGYSAVEAGSAIRVSLGPTTTQDEITRFADAWLAQLEKHRARAA